MTEAIFGLVGVCVGAFLQWVHAEWSARKERERGARYLAIRVVCLLDKYVEGCAAVVDDDGLSYGQRDKDGYLQPQVAAPSAPTFPEDLDWRSIDHALMYRILSLPNEAEAAARKIDFVWEYVAGPPDYDELFDERQDQYSRLGLAAFTLTQELRSKYSIPPQKFGEWNPVERLSKAKEQLEKDREDRKKQMVSLPNIADGLVTSGTSSR